LTEYEPVIGLEVHAQLRTRSKMYCSCPADYHQQTSPNTHVCPVCLGLPGTLPVINRSAVEAVIKTGLALHSDITEHTKFDRKNYPYPDLMKGYQISQFDLPVCVGGYIELDVDGETRHASITRVHLEEDVAKLFHRTDAATGEGYSLVDVNRAGVPLMELVGEPDLRSAEEAHQFLTKYRAILQYIGVSTGNMEEGSFRCDANISMRPKGSKELMSKVEVKNMNSFRAVQRALEYEMERQTKVAQDGGRVAQETRGWVEERGVTVSMRSKEFAHDYRFFPEPDLPSLTISRAWVEEVAERLPELPDAKKQRYMDVYGLSRYDAEQLTVAPAMARYYEDTLKEWESRQGGATVSNGTAKAAANWTITELTRLLNTNGGDIQESPLSPTFMVDLLELLEKGTIGTAQAKTAIEEAFNTGKSPRTVVEEMGLAQISDTSALGPVAAEAIEGNPQAVQDYLSGKETAVKFLVGQVMKASKGKANPSLVAEVIQEQLQALKR
jgi:aspartyl-tRNA(Asn)/glutamyl-tRNA(Gln) amidotransferase subunit B